MKFIYALLILIIAPKAHSAGLNLNGNQGYYELDISKIDALAGRIIDDSSPINQIWSEVTDKAFRRRPNPDQMDQNYLRRIYCDIQEKNGKERSSMTAWAILEASEARNTDEIIGILSQTLGSAEEKGDFLSQAQSHRETSLSKRIQDIISYHSLKTGPWKMGTLRNFINKAVLGIMGESPFPLEERRQLFTVMKETGFLKTHIGHIDGYIYSQEIAAEEFLNSHSNIDTLVLGCGSFVPARLAIPLFGDSEGGCGSCGDGHCVSKGEMTVSMPDQLNFDISSGYNEEGSASDIIGDIRAPELWTGIRKGLGGRELSTIKDHRWGGDALNYHMDAFSVLKEGGLLEIWNPGSHEIPWGFELKGVVQNENGTFLRLIKNSNL